MRSTPPKLSSPINLVFCALLLAAGHAQAANDPTKMEVLHRWQVGGAGGWDYLNFEQATGRLFVSRATRVDVIDTQDGKLSGSIPNTEGVHGIAFAPNMNRGFTSNGRANSITEFDLKTLKVFREVKIPGSNPDAILFEPLSKRVFTFNGKSKDVTVLDAADMKVVATIPVADKPEFAVTDGHGMVFVNIESEPGQMVAIDAKTLELKATWPLPACNSPSGLAIDTAHARLFSVCDDKVMAVTDAKTGKHVASVTIGEHPDAAAFDMTRGLAYSSNGDGTLSVIHQDSADRYTSAATVITQRGARTMALDPATGKIYLVTADFGPVPAPTTEQPHPRPALLPDSFVVLVVGTR